MRSFTVTVWDNNLFLNPFFLIQEQSTAHVQPASSGQNPSTFIRHHFHIAPDNSWQLLFQHSTQQTHVTGSFSSQYTLHTHTPKWTNSQHSVETNTHITIIIISDETGLKTTQTRVLSCRREDPEIQGDPLLIYEGGPVGLFGRLQTQDNSPHGTTQNPPNCPSCSSPLPHFIYSLQDTAVGYFWTIIPH